LQINEKSFCAMNSPEHLGQNLNIFSG